MSVWEFNHMKYVLCVSLKGINNSVFCCHLALSITCFPFTHIHPIRGQKRVTFAYLVSRVTRKKLSSGASIQLGRLLRIITPPRVFPLLLLRPLCCQKDFKYYLIMISVECIVEDLFKRHVPGGVHLLYLGSLQKQSHSSERKMQSMHEGLSVEKSIDWFISFPSYKWCNKWLCFNFSKNSEVTNKKQSVRLKLNHPNYPNDPHLLIRFH